MKTQKVNVEKVVATYNQQESKSYGRQCAKVGKLQAKEMQQVANEKTLSKNLCTTRQKLVNLQKIEVDELVETFVKHVNFCARKRQTVLCGFDGTAIKNIAKRGEINLYEFVDERGLNCVRALSSVVGILEKAAKELKKQQERELKKLASK